ncbi:acyltransferase [Metabacillus litoralis]|uniref:Galacturonic acid acetylase n=1 Tax=Metabacillus litoralis TaxID=152268 RepID=A0A179STK6_9BACI|nr:acyltransferase [Metabacillus litoralis]OAS85136.1 galacturonic acid acetylase [Metabacillus litoralis]
MISIIIKVIKTLSSQVRDRGIYYVLLMNMSHIIGVLRGYFYKLLYLKNIKSSIYSLQSKSSIEIFNENSKVYIGKFVFIRKNVSIRIDFNGELSLGDNVFINDNCTINCVSKVSIGENTKIAPNVCINDHDHNFKYNSGDHLIRGNVVIGKNVWIGSNVVILMNTTIGDNAVIAAGSVVKGEVPPNTLFFNKREKSYKSILIQDENVYKAN